MPPIVEDVARQLTEAMRAKDAPRVAALRGIRAALLHEMKRDGSTTIADRDALPVLRRLAKQHGESIEAFERAGRPERVAQERAELEVIESFLPRLADAQATRRFVREAMAETGARSPADLGRVMGVLMKQHRDEVDGALARRIAAEELGD